MRKTFLVKADPREMWRFDPDRDSAEIAGVEVKAFCPEGAAIKAYNLGLVKGGLKNLVVVEKDGGQVTGLYPMRYPLAMLLDAPLDYLRSLTY